MDNDFKTCYDDIVKLPGSDIELFFSCQLVEKYRQYWKPDKVNVILLAESHVFTSTSDLKYKLKEVDELEGYPDQYAKFVYCIAYGEQSITVGNHHPSKSDGTPQFWKIFYSCVNKIDSNRSFNPILKSKTTTSERLENKVDLLLTLKAKGVWLVDASIVALYNNGKKPDSKTFNEVIQTSWSGYTKNLIKEANPKHIIIVGKGVAKNVETDVHAMLGENYTVIPQPQAHLSAEQHLLNFQMYYDICCEF